MVAHRSPKPPVRVRILLLLPNLFNEVDIISTSFFSYQSNTIVSIAFKNVVNVIILQISLQFLLVVV